MWCTWTRQSGRYLPSLPAAHRGTTLRQLLTHRGGVRHYANRDFDRAAAGGSIDSRTYFSNADILAVFIDDPLVAPPGTRMAYSTFGYTLASLVLEAAAATPFLDLMQQRIAVPLGLASLAADAPRRLVSGRVRGYGRASQVRELPGASGDWANAPVNNPAYKWAGGGLVMTPSDLARFGAAHLAPGALSRRALDILFTVQVADSSPPLGLGWRIDRDGNSRLRWHHAGGQEGAREPGRLPGAPAVDCLRHQRHRRAWRRAHAVGAAGRRVVSHGPVDRGHPARYAPRGMADDPARLPVTEQENPRSRDIASMSIADAVALVNDEDARVAAAVQQVLPDVARAIEGIVAKLQAGGRLIHVGTGTSGRLGVLDASECPPTFGVSPELVQGLIAGGYDACYKAVEASEDDGEAGARDIAGRGVSANDAVVGIAASGRTPYTIGAVEHARALGAFTVAVTCVPDSAITRAVDVAIVPVVGPEVLAGSTRMKAGTAQKLVLNMLSTVTMIRLGYVTGNRMTHMRARNSKLQARSLRIIVAETGVDDATAGAALEATGHDLPAAIVVLKTSRTADEAKAALASANGVIAKAIAALR